MSSAHHAFISYNHKADGEFAPVLEHALERFGIPFHKSPKLDIFRDATNLSATSTLWADIEQHLDNSNYLLLLASPGAATSKGVRREVSWWLAHKKHSHIILIHTAGQIERPAGAQDFDWTLTDALPRVLGGAFLDDTPLWVDLRWAHDAPRRARKDPRFAVALADIAAPLRGEPKEKLIGEEVTRQRRMRQLAVASAVLTLAIAGVISFLIIQRAWTESAKNQATSMRLAEQSGNALEQQDVRLAALLGRAAFESADTPSARRALLTTLANGPLASLASSELPASNVGLSMDCEPSIESLGEFEFLSPGVHDVAVSHDGSSIAAVDSNNFIRLWRLPTTREPSTQVHSNDGVTSVGFATDGAWVFTGSTQGLAKWDAASLKDGCLVTDMDVSSFAIEPNGDLVTVGDSLGDVARVNIDTHAAELLADVSMQGGVQDVEMSQDGWLAVGHDDGTVHVWNVDDGAPTTFIATMESRPGSSEPIDMANSLTSLAWHPTRHEIAVAYDDGALVPWDAETGESLREPLTVSARRINDVQYNVDGTMLVAAADDGMVTLWNTVNWAKQLTFSTSAEDSITSVAFNPDGTLLVSGADSGATLLWSAIAPALTCGKQSPLACSASRVGDIGEVTAVAFASTTNYIAIAGDAAAVQICSTAPTLSCHPAFSPNGQVTAMSYSPAGDWLLFATSAGDVEAHGNAGEVRRFEAPEGFVAEFLSVNADGTLVAASGRTQVPRESGDQETEEMTLLWNTGTPEVWHPLPVGTSISALSFSPEPHTLLVAQGNQMTAWSIRDEALGEHLGYVVPYVDVFSVAFDARGERIVSGNEDGQVTVWSVGEREPQWTPPSLKSQGMPASGKAWRIVSSPDDRYVASASVDGEIVLWDVVNRDRTGTLGHVGAAVVGLHWADSQTLVAVDQEGIISTFDVDPKSWAQRACSVAGRDFDDDEATSYLAVSTFRACDAEPGSLLEQVLDRVGLSAG